jgi:hypothetical protein
MTTPQGQVTILIPHYKTLELSKLCLRLIRKYTDLSKAKVIVIDNDSQDASLDYLRSLSWIELIERKTVRDEGSISAHARALDLGLAHTTTPYVLSIHTDTLIKHPQWLDFLLTQINKSTGIAGVGSWKLEAKPWWREAVKKLERRAQLVYYYLIRHAKHGIEGMGKNYYYLRSHCAMYRTDLLKALNLSFSGSDMVAGKDMHKRLVEAGYRMIFLPSDILINYLDHINHATTVINPELSYRQKSAKKGLRRMEKSLAQMNVKEVLMDVSLDI